MVSAIIAAVTAMASASPGVTVALDDDPATPAACRPGRLAAQVVDFVDAYESHDRRRLRAHLAGREAFFSVFLGSGKSGRTPSAALRLLLRSHRPIELVTLEFGRGEDWNGEYGFGITWKRGTRYGYGKGSIECASGRLSTFNLGEPRRKRAPNGCEPAPLPRDGTVLACARPSDPQ
jgi:hypothetical protein